MKGSMRNKFIALLGVASLGLIGCGDSSAEAESARGDDKQVTIGYVVWDEVLAPTYLWKHILEDQGYDVELTQLEIAAVYAGVSQDDMDLYIGGLPETHADYWEEYSDGFEPVVEWYTPLRHGLAVPEYVTDVNEIGDLSGQADRFGDQIVGIEAGSGLMQELEAAEGAYDLSGYETTGSSTAAMLQEFETATNSEEDIVATVWNPHWAVGEYNMKFLDDPEGVFTDGDTYTVVASKQASQNQELMDLLAGFELEDEEFYDLLGELREAGEGNEDQAIENWLDDEGNQQLVDGWLQE